MFVTDSVIAVGDILEGLATQDCKAYRLVQFYPIGRFYELDYVKR